MMQRRRQLMAMQHKPKELYPIGTNLYDGVVFITGDFNPYTGEVIPGDNYAISDFLPVSTDYEYTRSYRLLNVLNYDENYNYLGYQIGENNLNTSVISAFLPGTKYIRTEVIKAYRNATTGLIGQRNCWLKRTA